MTRWDHEVDVLVAGSGNGGLSAAVAAAEAGARVLVLEMGSVTGGSSAMSGGGIAIGGATTYEEYVSLTHGMHDASLGRAYFDNFLPYVTWLKSIGAAIRPAAPPGLNVWMGDNPDGASEPQCRMYFDSLERALRSHDGQILLRTRARKLLTDERGRVTGLLARRWQSSPLETDGPQIAIRAKHVVLALGGFQNNKELCVKYIGPDADLISAVGSPYNRGEGMLLAQEVGAALSGSMSGIYGTFMSAYPARRPLESMEVWEASTEGDKTEMFNLLWFNTPPGFIAVNLNGERFIDEIEIRYRVIQATARQPRAMGIMLFDAAMYAEVADLLMLAPGSGATEREKFSSREKLEGKVLLEAETIEALAGQLAELGPHRTYKANLLKTVAECNAAADAGNRDLAVHRSELIKLQTPPFYAWPFTAGVVYTMGGLAINTSAQVLDRQLIPIPGLYASPPCAGGVFRDYYAGSIGSAGVFGWLAGRHAAQNTHAAADRGPALQRSP